MKVLCRLAHVVACALLVVGLSSTSFGALELRMSPNFVERPAPGAVDVDFVIFWDGSGTNQISSINFDVFLPAEVTLPDNTEPVNPMGFALRSIASNSVAFTNIAGNAPDLVMGDNLLTTLTFQASAFGDFPVIITLVEASQGGAFNFNDITAEFVNVTGGTISIVPEPSSLALLGLVSVGGFCFRRRR